MKKNEHGKLVVTSQNNFEKMQAMLRLYSMLDVVQKSAEIGDKGISHAQMMRRARARLKAFAK